MKSINIQEMDIVGEGHIKQILETLKPELLQHIRFDPEAGAFFATADQKKIKYYL
ncbi:MAG: hypothetical protein IPK62_08730 [Bacteroidetes bacterium]|nr:hypothetical protein [Bacteroidota bacterium]